MYQTPEGEMRYGRPPKPPEKRVVSVGVTFYPRQREKLRKAAARRGTTVSEVLRCLVDEMPPNGPSGIRRDG